MRLHLADAELAYLSACSTTDTSPVLTDEAGHLTAAVHLAGYRHVIGTLWPINDTAAARIATDVYTHRTNDGTQPARTEDSAHALAEATRDLRDDNPTLPTRWAAHLHLGV
jgi:CHAT domain-containing protein